MQNVRFKVNQIIPRVKLNLLKKEYDMKSLKIVGLSVLLASSLSLLNALDIGGLVGATKDLVDNTSDIASGKKQKEGEAKKAQKAEADAKKRCRR